MAFKVTSPFIGTQAIATTSTSSTVSGLATGQNHPLGTVVRAKDPTLGEGEFIYLLGVANTVVGSLVTWNATTYQTTLSPNTANLGSPVAVAMSANVASSYGWYQIAGLATIKKTAVSVAAQVAIYQSATAGRVMATAASGKQILSARSANLATVTATTSTVVVLINAPHLQGRVS
jgi:hypothetical protein